MFNNLGTQWASSIPAFLALVFAPLPFIFLSVGPRLRAQSRFANEAKAQLEKLQAVRQQVDKKFEEKHIHDAEKEVGMGFAADPEKTASTTPETSDAGVN